MPHKNRLDRPAEWEIKSVSVRARDAHHRLAQAYGVLLGDGARPPAADPGPDRSSTKEEENACRYLRQSVHRSPATEPDH